MQDSKPKKTNKYCCPAKQYYSTEAVNFGKVLKILPRVILYKKSLKIHNNYESIVNVKNNGLYQRHLACNTDSTDTTVQICPTQFDHNFLPPGESLKITVHITPKAKLKINRRRHVFITSQHPNITFSIPIIILADDVDNIISLPPCVVFPSTAVQNFTYYEMVVYNKSAKKIQFGVKCPLSNVTVYTNSNNILRKDYKIIILRLYCADLNVVFNSVKLKLSTGDNFSIPFQLAPLQYSLFVNTLNMDFGTVPFEREETQEFSICNESNTNVVFYMEFIFPEETIVNDNNESIQTITTDTSLTSTVCEASENIDKFAYKHFRYRPTCGTVFKNSIYMVKITFKPTMHNDFAVTNNDFPPFNVKSGVSVTWKSEMDTTKLNICLKGKIIGPEIEFTPEVIDLRNVYFGEEHSFQITAFNKDDICSAYIQLYDLSDWHAARVIATPKDGLNLEPNESGVFLIKFYSTQAGKFIVKLKFIVKNGYKYVVSITGDCHHVQVKCIPDIINFKVVPIALPQKRLVLLANPLSVPLTVQCTVQDDGIEIPLVLNIHDTGEHLPISVNDPYESWQQTLYQEFGIDHLQIEDNCEILSDFAESETQLRSIRSQDDDSSCCSSEFERLALEHIPELSQNLVFYLKKIKVTDKPEMEKIVMEQALNALLNTPYFIEMEKCKNYLQMDWNLLPTDPREVYCNTEIIHLKPNSGKAVSIIIIPNNLGYHRKYIQMRVCPQVPSIDIHCKDNPELCQIVDSKFMTTKLCVEYECSVPEIIWENIIIMEEALYAGEYYDFEMVFENNSDIGGFFYYDVIPCSSSGTMKFANNQWKYFIQPNSKIIVPCQVKFTKLGFVNLCGLIKFLGVYSSFPYHIKSQVLPPRVKVFPRSISKTLQAFEFVELYIFIQNVTPTSTWFKLELKDKNFMSIEPKGGRLAPSGQVTYVTVSAMFHDPGIYKNILHVILEFEIVEKVPVTITVKSIPLFFEPEVRSHDINIGYVLCNTEEEYSEEKPNLTKVIKVINRGFRQYRLTITKTKSSARSSCNLNTSKSKLTIKPNNLIVPGQSEMSFSFLISCCEETTVFNEFRLQLIDTTDVQHMESYRIVLTATFINAELSWNRRDVTMNYYSTHKYKEHDGWEMIKLTNMSQSNIDHVNLNVSKPFKIKELYEHKLENELNFSMTPFETKEYFIMFEKEAVKNSSKDVYEGTITCFANSKVQKKVRLKLFVYIPKITLNKNDYTYFNHCVECGTYIGLTNMGRIPVSYKWKKLKEERHYISEEENAQQAASIILSDVIRMLEIVNPELDSETNMTLRYQKYKCAIKKLEDPINIKEILYEIIENLDLTIKRYKLNYPSPLLSDGSLKKDQLSKHSVHQVQFEIEEALNTESSQLLQDSKEKLQTLYFDRQFQANSSDLVVAAEKLSNVESYVCYTLDDILSHLKLEDSYDELSLLSSEVCDFKNSLYFFEKCGQVQENQAKLCALHIPPVRRGFEVQAEFELVVVGGESQKLKITLVNLDETVVVNKQNIHLGLKPWYERYQTISYIENPTNYEVVIKIEPISKILERNITNIALGYNKILGDRKFHIPPFHSAKVKTEGALGFMEEYKRDLRINVNESEEIILTITGHGAMPMIIMHKPTLPLMSQYFYEIIEEYHLLKKIYYFEIFKTITEVDDADLYAVQEEDNDYQEAQHFLSDLTLLSDRTLSNTIRSPKSILMQMEFLNIIRSYVFVNHNEDLPNCAILEQLLQTEKFLNHLRFNFDTSSLLKALYHNYLLHLKTYDEKAPINLKHFTVQPLPFQLTVHMLNMGKVYIDEYSKFDITLDFLGPGKFMVAARTAVKIPGLVVDFKIMENDEDIDVFYYHTDNKLAVCDKQYRNMSERQLDKKNNPKVKHAHSYDFSPTHQHQRVAAANDLKCIKDYYNSLNKSIYLEQKYHFTHCKITAKSKTTFPRIKMIAVILFRPQKPYYSHNQHLEDYLYIDLHMGATLPILLRAVIADRKWKKK